MSRHPSRYRKAASTRLSVLSVVSEVYPLAKTGGLADVAAALPPALAAEAIDVLTLVPGYPAILAAIEPVEATAPLPDLMGGPARLLLSRVGNLDLAVLDAPRLFDRPGRIYQGPDGRDWPDNGERFAALAHAAVAVVDGAAGFAPDLVHCHDWQAGLVPALLHGRDRRPATVMTVHNLAFQGTFPAHLLDRFGLAPDSFSINGVEYYGGIGFLKAGLYYADHITTVSPAYALEIMTREGGMGLDGLLRGRAGELSGILNGLDTAVWNPSEDPALAATFDAKDLGRRARNKSALQARLGLAREPDTLLFGVVSRLTWQKGIDLLIEVLPTLVGLGAQLALLGTGDGAYEEGLRAAERRYPGRIACRFGLGEPLAHLIQGGADAILVPSRFEPCGLTQLAAERYGAIPVAARVGGLGDTIIDANDAALRVNAATGVLFTPGRRDAFELGLERTSMLWQNRVAWRKLQRRGMASDVGWARSASRYAALFRDLVARRRPLAGDPADGIADRGRADHGARKLPALTQAAILKSA